MTIKYLAGNRLTGSNAERLALTSTYGWQDFDGSADYVSIPASPLSGIGGSDDFSIAFWIKSDNFAGGSQPVILGCHHSDTESYTTYFELYEISGALVIRSTNSSSASVVTTSSLTGIEDDAWHHIAVIRSGSTLTFYKDGSSSSTHTLSGHTLPAPETYLHIGRRGDNAQYCDMQLQDLGFWSRALSSADVSVLAGGVPIDRAVLATAYTTDLEGYYKFNGNYNDSKSGSSNHGTGVSTADPNTTSGGKFHSFSDIPIQSIFSEWDTGDHYIWSGSAWNEMS